MYKADLVAWSVISDIMVGGDEVQDETQGQQLTNEEEVDEKEAADALLVLLKKIMDTIMMEEFFEVNRKMNLFRIVLAEGIKKFAEEHMDDKPKMERFVDSFRAGWKVYKVNGDKKATMDVFMKTMNNELWVSEDT